MARARPCTTRPDLSTRGWPGCASSRNPGRSVIATSRAPLNCSTPRLGLNHADRYKDYAKVARRHFDAANGELDREGTVQDPAGRYSLGVSQLRTSTRP